MTTAVVAFAAFVVAAGLVVGVLYVLARRRVRQRESGAGPAASELVPQLTEEVRKWQAEAAYWKQTATRLQRELDRRPEP